MRFQSPRHPCGCRSAGECQHDNGPTLAEDKQTLGYLVSEFSHAMKVKLHEKAEKRGGWDAEEWTVDDIKRALIDHVDRGDPVDVANFCAFWWNRLSNTRPCTICTTHCLGALRLVAGVECRGLRVPCAGCGTIGDEHSPMCQPPTSAG